MLPHLEFEPTPKPLHDRDSAALRKLRDDDASGALKKMFGDSEEPLDWKEGSGDKAVTVSDGRVTKLDLYQCSDLKALPAAIGKLGALTKLDLSYCSSLAELPAAISELGALTELNLHECTSLASLPDAIGELKALTKAKKENEEFLDKIEEKFRRISTAAETRVVELNDKKCCVVA